MDLLALVMINPLRKCFSLYIMTQYILSFHYFIIMNIQVFCLWGWFWPFFTLIDVSDDYLLREDIHEHV